MSLYADWEIRNACSFKHNKKPIQVYFTIYKSGEDGNTFEDHRAGYPQTEWNIVDDLDAVSRYLDLNEEKSHRARLEDISKISYAVCELYRHFIGFSEDQTLEHATKAIRAFKALMAMSPTDTVKGATAELGDGYIFRIWLDSDDRMIYPYVEHSENKLMYREKEIKVPSYGTSSYGYDIRLSNKFLIADDRRKPGHEHVVDCAKNNSADFYNELTADSIDLIPGGFILAVSREWIHVPRDVMVTCLGKSSVARDGIYAFVTPLESDWHGYVTLEIKNLSPNTVRLYAGQGIMQLLFQKTGSVCEVSYADRKGKYQGQHERPIPSEY